jgi:cyclic pyranopterin phosphate synthase
MTPPGFDSAVENRRLPSLSRVAGEGRAIGGADGGVRADAPRGLTDRHGRVKRKLRISLTDRCNFRCRYCMPVHPQWIPKKELLSREELGALARLFVESGIESIRVTGGEPLLRPDAADCIAALNGLRAIGLKRLSLTTNASRLAPRLAALRAAGLDDLNISLDALDPQRFQALRGQAIAPVLDGIEAARAAGLPFKLNTVLIRGQNEAEILPLTQWAMERGAPLRFIEYMPLDAPGNWSKDAVIPEEEVLAQLTRRYRVERLARTGDPATEFLLDGHYRLGLITTISNPFCGSCDRLRLTARGELYACLFSKRGPNLGAALRAGATRAELLARIRAQVWNKEAGYAALHRPVERPILMHAVGG